MARWSGEFTEGALGSQPNLQPHHISLQCPACGADPDALVRNVHVTPGKSGITPGPVPGVEDASGQSLHLSVYSYFASCTRCYSAIMIQSAYGESPKAGKSYRAVENRVFPLPTTAFATGELEVQAIPSAILEDLRQAELAHAAGAPYGAGLLLRRACQYLCRDKGATARDLNDQIPELKTAGLITDDLAKQAHHVRLVGNELAHPDANRPAVITNEDILDARDFLEQLVRAVYVDPARNAARRASLQQRGVKGA